MESSTIRFDALLYPAAAFDPALQPNDKSEGCPKTWPDPFSTLPTGWTFFQPVGFTNVDPCSTNRKKLSHCTQEEPQT